MEEVPFGDAARRIRSLFAERNLQAHEFALSIGQEPSAMADVLDGRREPSSLELALIAEGLDTTLPALLAPKEAQPLSAVAARVTDRTVAVGRALDRLVELADLARLLDTVGESAPPYLLEPLPPGLRAYEQGALRARAVRAELGFGHDDPLPEELGTLMSMIEQRLSIDIAVDHLPPGVDGVSATQGTSRFILLNSRVPSTRMRWTLAHELGHLENGDCETLVVDESVLGGADEIETRANGFAAEFLAPGPLLARLSGGGPLDAQMIGSLLERLGISLDALANRLHNCRLIDAAERDRVKAIDGARELVRRSSRLSGLGTKGDQRIPKRLMRGLLDAYFDRHIAIQPLATLLGVSADDLLREFGRDEGYDQEGVRESA